ncbi:MAG: hypothetical protein EOM06_05850 [Sphingobacteriia bacterium]|nr:hypothetical protein [Sphingobacteriia bacterium]
MILCQVAKTAEVTIIITSIPDNTPLQDHIYIAGNFNGWAPGNPDFILINNTNELPEITLTGSGTIEFKFTRGSWETVEGNENGGFLPNRQFVFGAVDTLFLTILTWEDTGNGVSTAAENVSIMDDAFYMPQLDRYRRIWLYLPPGYETSGKSYPVLYMHDGQNLFDNATSFAGEWEVDETLNTFHENGKEVPIVVGIENGGEHRIAEYTPWVNPQYGGGDGDQYSGFIAETLKPYIDSNYRTKPEREHTGVMGSSLGGLISHYIVLKYQHIFSKAGVFSPSFWFSDSSYTYAFETGKMQPINYYMMGGTNENAGLEDEMQLMMDTMIAAGFDSSGLHLKIVPGGQHNESLWRSQFAEAWQWLFLDGASSVTGFEISGPVNIRISEGKLILESNSPQPDNSRLLIDLYSLAGQRVMRARLSFGEFVVLPETLHGIFVVHIMGKGIQSGKKIFIN